MKAASQSTSRKCLGLHSPLADRERKEQISKKFGVRGIPMLIVLNGTSGEMVQENGRSEVQSTKDLGKCLASWVSAKTAKGSAQTNQTKKGCSACCVIS